MPGRNNAVFWIMRRDAPWRACRPTSADGAKYSSAFYSLMGQGMSPLIVPRGRRKGQRGDDKELVQGQTPDSTLAAPEAVARHSHPIREAYGVPSCHPA